jgi:hypothetical protein
MAAVTTGFVAGVAVAAIEAWGGGAVRPVVIVALVIAAGLGVGLRWAWGGWPGALALAVPVPGLHMVRHVLGLPDTIQPNTYDAIVMMALFHAALAGAGLAAGAVLRAAVADEAG